MNWFDVDKEGLARLLERKGKAFAVLELVQNAWDEATTTVDIKLHPDGRGKANLVVTDDNPEGFKFIEHAYTLFAESTKVSDPEKRGRFNLGEKLFLAVCDRAQISTVKGTVTFESEGRKLSKRGTPAGTVITATIRLNKDEQAEVARLIHTLLPPSGIKTVFNGEEISPRRALRSFEATLPTEVADGEGVLRPTRRKTTITIYEPLDGEAPHIYEMGIPVCEHDGRWHVNVEQKVPLNFNRDNVTPAYLRQVREIVLNQSFDLLDQEEAHKPWVAEALPNASDEAFRKVVTERFGEKVAIRDNAHPEATLRAVEAGYHLIEPRSLPKGSNERLKDLGVARPAGQHPEFRRDIPTSVDGKDYSIPEEKWTDGMYKIVHYAGLIAQELLGRSIEVKIMRYPIGFANNCGAAFNGYTLKFNLTTLSHRFFNERDREDVDALLIHEFAHAKADNHFSDAFYNECCRLGAKLRTCQVWPQ